MARILVVDDVRFISQMLAGIFESQGHGVVIAADGAEGIEKAGSELPDLILMDVAMPGIDGLEAARQIKNNDDTATIPILMVTSRNDSGTLAKAKEAGVDDYILKPFETPHLLEKAGELLGGFPMHYDLTKRGEAIVVVPLASELANAPVNHLRRVLRAAREVASGLVVLDLTSVTKVENRVGVEVLGFLGSCGTDGFELAIIKPERAMGIRALVGQLVDRVQFYDDQTSAFGTLGIDPEDPGNTIRTARKSNCRPVSGSAPAGKSRAAAPVGSGSPPKPRTDPAATESAPGTDSAPALSTDAGAVPSGGRRTSPAKGIVVELHPKATIIRVSLSKLEEAFFEALAAEAAKPANGAPLLLELGGLTALDSNESWELAALADKAAESGRALRVVNPTTVVLAAMEKAELGHLVLLTQKT